MWVYGQLPYSKDRLSAARVVLTSATLRGHETEGGYRNNNLITKPNTRRTQSQFKEELPQNSTPTLTITNQCNIQHDIIEERRAHPLLRVVAR